MKVPLQVHIHTHRLVRDGRQSRLDTNLNSSPEPTESVLVKRPKKQSDAWQPARLRGPVDRHIMAERYGIWTDEYPYDGKLAPQEVRTLEPWVPQELGWELNQDKAGHYFLNEVTVPIGTPCDPHWSQVAQDMIEDSPCWQVPVRRRT